MNDNKIIDEAVALMNEGYSVTLPVSGRSMLPFIIGGTYFLSGRWKRWAAARRCGAIWD